MRPRLHVVKGKDKQDAAEESPMKFTPASLRAHAERFENCPTLRAADALEADNAAHAVASTRVGQPVPPALCDRIDGLIHRARQLHRPEMEIAKALREEADRLERGR